MSEEDSPDEPLETLILHQMFILHVFWIQQFPGQVRIPVKSGDQHRQYETECKFYE